MDEQQQPRSVHVTGYASHSISTDGTTAMIVLEIASGGHFAITLPVDHLKAVRSGFTQLIDMAAHKTGNSMPKFPNNMSVGFSDDIGNVTAPNGNSIPWRDCVLVQFDGGSDNEALYVLTKKDGLTFADNLKTGVMKRLTPAERREWFTKPSLEAKPKIIRP